MTRTPGTRRLAVAIEHRVLGVTFVSLLALFVWLTFAIFNKTFSDYVEVTLRAARTGLQLPDRADVKVRGMVVGSVLDRKVTAQGAVLTLGLYPGRLAAIPANVTARILPKTLFGEKYVALQVPAHPSSRSIRAGDVIRESRVAIEVQKVLRDFYPLLRTVQPAQLNYTLTSIADALEGRGQALGHNLVVLDDYLRRMNPQVPQLVDDLGKLATVSDTYSQVMPRVAQILRNSVVTGRTFVDREQKVKALFDDVAAFSSTSRGFLQANGDNIIRLSRLGQEQLATFARYSPEYPCLLKGIVGVIPRLAESFRGYQLHIDLEPLPRQPRGYGPQDNPVYGADAGPSKDCNLLLNFPYSQSHLPPPSMIPNFDDGVNQPLGTGGNNRPAPMLDLGPLLMGPLAESGVSGR